MQWLLLLQSTAREQLSHRGLAALRNVGSSLIRYGPRVPCIGRQILSHWTTREVLEKFSCSTCFPIDPATLSLYLPVEKLCRFI